MLAGLSACLPVFSSKALDPSSFTSLGANPFTATGAYTINSAATPPVLSRPGLSAINGVVSGGEAVFTFDTIAIPSGATIQGGRGSGARPIALLSQGASSLASGATIDVSGANGVSANFVNGGAQEDGGAAGPGGGGGGGGAADDVNTPGNGGAGSPNGGNYVLTGNNPGPGAGGSVGANGGGGSYSSYIGPGGGGYGGSGGSSTAGIYNGYPGQAYGNLGVNTGGTTFGATLQGGSGGGGGTYGYGGGGGGGGGGIQEGGGGAGGGIYLHGASISLAGGINASGGAGASYAVTGGGGGGGRVFLYTATGQLSGGSLGNVNVSGGSGYVGGGSGAATLAGPGIAITVNTTPGGLAFSVDGTNYANAQILNLVAGRTHTLAVNTPQPAGSGAQYVFSSWSDGGARSHTVTPASNLTYTAAFVLGATHPSVLASPAKTNSGPFSLAFTNVTGASFTVLAATNISLALSNWTPLGAAVENPGGSGHYQFSDSGATNHSLRFYDVRSP